MSVLSLVSHAAWIHNWNYQPIGEVMFVVPIMNNNRWSPTYGFHNHVRWEEMRRIYCYTSVSIVLPNFFVINCIQWLHQISKVSHSLIRFLRATKIGVDKTIILVNGKDSFFLGNIVWFWYITKSIRSKTKTSQF